MTQLLQRLRNACASLGWPRASLRTYLVAVLLIATVPLAALLVVQSLHAENTVVVRSLWVLGACLLVGLGLALLLARRIAEPLGELGGEDPAAASSSSPVREIEALQVRLRASRAAEATARAEAERASRAKDEFMAMLGHELRNPLAAISSAVDVLSSPGASAELTATARDIVERQTHNLARMLDDLLDLGRVLSGRVQLSRRPFDLAALVRRVTTALRPQAGSRDDALACELAPAWIDADAERIEQVVVHLLGNAIRYTGAERRITVSLRREARAAVLRVSDNGPGIAPDVLPHVFELFVQGERDLARQAGGLGAGLTRVRRLVEMHAGTVHAESSARGAVFEVRLPAIDAPPEPGPAPEPAEAWGVAPRRIVLIEDNTDAARALQASLELDGHHVRSASDGTTGLALLLAERPDAAIVDLGLPGLTGFDVALRSRAAGFPGLMVATSGYGQQADEQRALRSGFDALLVKPVDAARLRALLAGQD